MAKQLRELPPVEKAKQHFSRQEAVTKLKAEIMALQKRGYSLEQVSEALKAVGIEIATPTLKSYLQRAKGSTPKTRQEKRPRIALAPNAEASSAPSSSDTVPSPKSTAARQTGLGRPVLPVQKENTTTDASPQKDANASPKGVFELRDDTDDI